MKKGSRSKARAWQREGIQDTRSRKTNMPLLVEEGEPAAVWEVCLAHCAGPSLLLKIAATAGITWRLVSTPTSPHLLFGIQQESWETYSIFFHLPPKQQKTRAHNLLQQLWSRQRLRKTAGGPVGSLGHGRQPSLHPSPACSLVQKYAKVALIRARCAGCPVKGGWPLPLPFRKQEAL